jgi:hypothetical protein
VLLLQCLLLTGLRSLSHARVCIATMEEFTQSGRASASAATRAMALVKQLHWALRQPDEYSWLLGMPPYASTQHWSTPAQLDAYYFPVDTLFTRSFARETVTTAAITLEPDMPCGATAGGPRLSAAFQAHGESPGSPVAGHYAMMSGSVSESISGASPGSSCKSIVPPLSAYDATVVAAASAAAAAAAATEQVRLCFLSVVSSIFARSVTVAVGGRRVAQG